MEGGDALRARVARLLYVGAVLIAIVGLGVWARGRATARVEQQVALLAGDDAERANEAARTTVRMGRRAVKPLILALRESGPGMAQERIAGVLGEIGDPRAADALFEAARLGSLPAAQAFVPLGLSAAEPAALARCVRGERLLRKAERAIPYACTLADALAVGSTGPSDTPPQPSRRIRQVDKDLEEWGHSVGHVVWQAEQEFALSLWTDHRTARAVRGLFRARALAPEACANDPYVPVPTTDPEVAALVRTQEEQRRRRKTICRSLPTSHPDAAQIRGIVRLAPGDDACWRAAALVEAWPEGWEPPQNERPVRASVLVSLFLVQDSGSVTQSPPPRTERVWGDNDLRGAWVAADDLNGDGRPELVVTADLQDNPGGGGPTYAVAVYRWNGRRLVELFRGHSELPVVVSDLDGDGDKEIVLAYAACMAASYPGAPMWPVTYTLRNGAYVPSSEEYVKLYRDALPDFERGVKVLPQDPKVLDCLARIYRILGRRKQALKVFKVARAAYKSYGVYGDIGRIGIPRVEQHIKELEEEIGAAGQTESP